MTSLLDPTRLLLLSTPLVIVRLFVSPVMFVVDVFLPPDVTVILLLSPVALAVILVSPQLARLPEPAPQSTVKLFKLPVTVLNIVELLPCILRAATLLLPI